MNRTLFLLMVPLLIFLTSVLSPVPTGDTGTDNNWTSITLPEDGMPDVTDEMNDMSIVAADPA